MSNLEELNALYRDTLARAEGESANEGSEHRDPDTWLLARGDELRSQGEGGGGGGECSCCDDLRARIERLERKDIINVKDYGAVGDGETDDTAAIQAALDIAEKKAVWFPAGSYRISQTLRITFGGCTVMGTSATIMLPEYLPRDTDAPNNTRVSVADAVHRVVGFRIVGVSDVRITGFRFEKVWHGVDAFLSESPGDYPATESNNIHDIIIDNCTFDTSQWAISAVGVYGLTVSNVTFQQERSPTSYSNKDGVHLHGCCNVVIDKAMGTTDDDFVAIFPAETYIGTSRSFYGVCNKIFIMNCVVNNNTNVASEEGTRSFLGLDGIALDGSGNPAVVDTVHDFSVDNVVVSNCSIATDTGVVVRMGGGAVKTLVGSLAFKNCYIGRSFTPDKIIEARNSISFLLKSSIDEFVLDGCTYELDSRFDDSTFKVGMIGVYKNIRKLTLSNCSLTANNDFVIMDRLHQDEDDHTTPYDVLDSTALVEVRDCQFEVKQSNNRETILKALRREIKTVVLRNIQFPTWIENVNGEDRVRSQIGNAVTVHHGTEIGEVHVDRVCQTFSPFIQIVDSDCVVSEIFLHAVSIRNNVVGFPDEQYEPSVSIIGDFSSKISMPFADKVDNIKASGVHLSDTTWATKSDPGSICWFGPTGGWKLGIMDGNETWRLLERES